MYEPWVLLKQWKVYAVRASYILDKNGNIRYSVAGGVDWISKEVKTAIDGLLNEK